MNNEHHWREKIAVTLVDSLKALTVYWGYLMHWTVRARHLQAYLNHGLLK
jgi:hypothetical protein